MHTQNDQIAPLPLSDLQKMYMYFHTCFLPAVQLKQQGSFLIPHHWHPLNCAHFKGIILCHCIANGEGEICKNRLF